MGIEDQCKPTIVYLVITVLMVIGITGYNLYKGKGISYSGLCSQMLSTCCCVYIINYICGISEMLAWLFLILPIASAIGGLINTVQRNDLLAQITGGAL